MQSPDGEIATLHKSTGTFKDLNIASLCTVRANAPRSITVQLGRADRPDRSKLRPMRSDPWKVSLVVGTFLSGGPGFDRLGLRVTTEI